MRAYMSTWVGLGTLWRVNAGPNDVGAEAAEREARAILAETEPGPIEAARSVRIGETVYLFEEVIQAALADALRAFVEE